MSEKEENNLFYVCSLIEHVGRKTKNRRSDVVAAMDDCCLMHQFEYADINHSLPFDRVSDELIAECGIKEGTFDTIAGCRYSIPSETSIGRVYTTLIAETDEGDMGKSLRKVFGSFISDAISDFANGVYYQNPSYLLKSRSSSTVHARTRFFSLYNLSANVQKVFTLQIIAHSSIRRK